MVNYVFPEPKIGDVFTGVIEVDQGDTGEICHLVGYDRLVKIDSVLPSGKHTVYGFQVGALDPLVLLGTQTSKVVTHVNLDDSKIVPVIELCAGMAGIGMGLTYLGCKVVVAMDCNEYACRHLRSNHGFPTICGSVLSDADLQKVHVACHGLCGIVSAGFPCQPYSTQGDLGGLSDGRATVILGICRACYLFGACAGMLECVPGAGVHGGLQLALRAFCHRMGWKLSSVNLDLSAQWPVRRARWWAVLCSQECTVHLTSWSFDRRYATVGHVLAEWPCWEQKEEEALRFTEEETSKMYDHTYGSEPRRLELTSVCSCFLHSYAHVLSPCPCLCRSVGFSEARLVSGGIRGFGVLSRRWQFERFLHAHEMAFLMAFPSWLKFEFGRHDLPLIGQAASPLQSIWVGHSLLSAVLSREKAVLLPPVIECLDRYRQSLLRWRFETWTWYDTCAPRHVSMDLDFSADRSFFKEGIVRVQDILRAESVFGEWGTFTRVYDGTRILPDRAVLQCRGFDGPYHLVRTKKKQCTSPPVGIIAVRVEIEQCCKYAWVLVGSFLFQVFWELDLPSTLVLHDEAGVVVRADTRLWSSVTLSDEASLNSTPCGFGILSSHDGLGRKLRGLSVPFMHCAAKFLIKLSKKKCFLHGVSEYLDDHAWLFGFGPTAKPPIGEVHYFLILSERHWTLLELKVVATGITVCLYDGLRPRPPPSFLHTIIERYWDLFNMVCVDFRLRMVVSQSLMDSCGTIALGHLAYSLGLVSELDCQEIELLHPGLAACDPNAQHPFGLGPGQFLTQEEQDVTRRLATILEEHGVLLLKVWTEPSMDFPS